MAHETTSDSTQRADALARIYAEALFELAERAGVLDEVADELGQLTGLMDSQAELEQFLASPAIYPPRRAASLDTIFRGRLSDLTCNFLQVLNRKGRLGHLRAIESAFRGLLRDKYGEVDVDLTTAGPLDPAIGQRIADRLSAVLGRQAVVHEHVDQRIIGGLKVRVGDRLLDGSVATRLQQLGRRLQQAGRDSARQQLDRLIEP